MGLIQFSQRRDKGLEASARLKPGIESFDKPSALGSYTFEAGIYRKSVTGAGVAGWEGNGVNAIAYRPTRQTIVGSGGANSDSLAIGAMFSATTTGDGTLVSLGVSTNVTGGYFQIGFLAGAINVSADDAANTSSSRYSSTRSYIDGRIHCAIAVIQSHPAGQRLRLYVDGVFAAGGFISGWNATTYNRFCVCGLRRSASGGFARVGQQVHGAFAFKPKADLDVAALSALGWEAFYAPRRIWVPQSAAPGALLGGATVTDLTSSSFRPRVNIISLPS